ncbi:Dam family site-specific DNA-(adenine-N6)-methyltransferase [Morganella morganii]|uniref:DNA adenine methylase n=1 Tax=Morganella morganii TaxID=582 RepID=UPI001BDA097B|nr:Dam family site-specific DNA-(adenine-N6)-methyltransferase [Morganella morganii]EJK8623005.1 Dam family site-specific DNA-(adenine-N6)-methyltransferase [Morganella morganii]EKW5727752.1 Dam family site-specific DNA-(adenine-N6)-methyltransferase [Morganella morganii]MBT0503476.1 Dam family site-specific DNA-(adenine-N6)-methyltransferase [Morganella morganii subsp. morganii]MDW7786550.1 Dam family site-specific DNA-(adenine-N6)-methyltransferase [Morganella morganii]QWM11952.1 Dam family 
MAEKTILKWAGSKVGIMEQLRPHLPKTKRLVEPFAGSCAVMMNTDYEQYLIADVNTDLINLYKIIKYCDPDVFIGNAELIFLVSNEKAEYYKIRDLFNEESRFRFSNPLTLAVWFLYLNRHGYNGLCRYSKRTGFNVPFGDYKKTYFPEKEIRAFSAKTVKAAIIRQGWAETLLQTCAGDGIYCDPPYMGKGFTKYHIEGFNDGDQVALAEALQTLHVTKGYPITVSNSIDAKELYADLGFTIHEIKAPRTIAANGNRKPVTEIIATLGA